MVWRAGGSGEAAHAKTFASARTRFRPDGLWIHTHTHTHKYTETGGRGRKKARKVLPDVASPSAFSFSWSWAFCSPRQGQVRRWIGVALRRKADRRATWAMMSVQLRLSETLVGAAIRRGTEEAHPPMHIHGHWRWCRGRRWGTRGQEGREAPETPGLQATRLHVPTT